MKTLKVLEVLKAIKIFRNNESRIQIKRSTISISLNIAEGIGKSSPKDFANFIRIAIGSLIETDASLKIAVDLNFITQTDYKKN